MPKIYAEVYDEHNNCGRRGEVSILTEEGQLNVWAGAYYAIGLDPWAARKFAEMLISAADKMESAV